MSQERQQCVALTKAGTRCKNKARPGSELCHVHQASTPEPTAETAAAAAEAAEFRQVVEELNELAQELQEKADYTPPPFTPSGLLELLRENMHRFTPETQRNIVRGLQQNLQGASPKDLFDPEVWQGMWYLLNYSLQQESKSLLGNVRKRLSTLPGASTVTSLPGMKTLSGLQGMLVDTSPKDFLDVDVWKGMWYLLNYSLRYEAGEMKRRIVGFSDEGDE